MLNERGEIYHRARAKQLRDYSGLRFGNITPTDIDGLIEYHGKAFIIIELKYNDAPIFFGQMLALERLTDDLGKPAICIIANHNIANPEQDVDVATCLVSQYRFKGVWRLPKKERTVKEIITLFLDLVDGN